jgi:hypothetical protein
MADRIRYGYNAKTSTPEYYIDSSQGTLGPFPTQDAARAAAKKKGLNIENTAFANGAQRARQDIANRCVNAGVQNGPKRGVIVEDKDGGKVFGYHIAAESGGDISPPPYRWPTQEAAETAAKKAGIEMVNDKMPTKPAYIKSSQGRTVIVDASGKVLAEVDPANARKVAANLGYALKGEL